MKHVLMQCYEGHIQLMHAAKCVGKTYYNDQYDFENHSLGCNIEISNLGQCVYQALGASRVHFPFALPIV